MFSVEFDVCFVPIAEIFDYEGLAISIRVAGSKPGSSSEAGSKPVGSGRSPEVQQTADQKGHGASEDYRGKCEESPVHNAI
jgi:hypothetical protein